MTTTGSARLALAEHWLEVGRPADTLRELDAAGSDAVSRQGLSLRGRAHLHLGDGAQAVEYARRGLTAAPDDIGLLGLLAAGLGTTGDLEGAELALLAALRQAPDVPGLLVYYATLLTQAGQYDKAERVLERAARVAPDEPSVFAERADLALQRGHKREARRWSREALARDPEHAGARVTAGVLAMGEGDMGSARRHLHSAAAQDLSNAGLRRAAREAGYLAHPLMVPLRLPARLGLFGTYLLGMTIVLAAGAAGGTYGGVAALVWVTFVVYTWVVPRLLRVWLRRRGRW